MKQHTRVWPSGTMVVTRAAVAPGDGGHTRPKGSCGVIIKAPSEPGGTYRVRFLDGVAFLVKGGDIEVLKHYQERALGTYDAHATQDSLFEHVHYACIVGSRAYGLEHEGSDVDMRGFFVPPADMHWSLYGVPEQIERPGADEVYWEVEKFIKLAMKANPNVLECLYTPLVEYASPIGQVVLDARALFLSKMIYQTYSRYVMSQFKNMSRRVDKGEEVKPKHVMHLLRLMLSGIHILKEGFVPVLVKSHRTRLLEIKSGAVSWEETERWRMELHSEFDREFERSRLPEMPDHVRANALLMHVRRWACGFDVVHQSM